MLTADLVRARRRGDRLHLLRLEGPSRREALRLAAGYLPLARASVGLTREDFEEAAAAVARGGRDRRLAAGILKLVEDRCTFEMAEGADPRALRQEVFLRASAARQALPDGARLERRSILETVARERELEVAALERCLYADLRGAHRLLAFAPIDAEGLIAEYELAQAQAVLLRARRITAEVTCASPPALRHLFHQLKFRRLLHTIEEVAPATYRLDIDGPFSLFRSITRYGLQLALALPALRACDHWTLEADLLWGKERRPLRFSLAGGAMGREATGAAADPSLPAVAPAREALLPEEVRALLSRFRARSTGWRVSPCAEVLALPGAGVCVPDLLFEHAGHGCRVYLEVLGYWSREAVWRRVELVERGLLQRVLFAVSRRLRVGEEALDEKLPGALYVFKGALDPAAVERKLEELAARPLGPR